MTKHMESTSEAKGREFSQECFCLGLEHDAEAIADGARQNTFEHALDAMESFLEGFVICDRTMTLAQMEAALDLAEGHFAEIDRDEDGTLSPKELLDFASCHPEMRRQIEWLLFHYGALRKAAHLRQEGALCSEDLHAGAGVFAGLSCIERHFDEIARANHVGPDELIECLRSRRSLSGSECEALALLLSYARTVRKGDGFSYSLSQLESIEPEDLWA